MKIAICDDDIEYINKIESLLEEYRDEKGLQISSFNCGEEFLKDIDENNKQYDILFLDIEMKEISGLDIAKVLKEKGQNAIVFFVTSYTSYVSDTFTLGAFQFLVKPIEEEIFRKEFERALEEYVGRRKKYLVRWKGTTRLLDFDEIFYIEVFKKHLYIYTKDKKYECFGKLSDEAEKLKLYKFSRCHQAYIVNLTKIRSVEKQMLIMENEVVIPIGRKYRKDLNDDFTLYMAGRLI